MLKSQYQYQHSIIRAPFPGRVVQRLINPGEYATVGKDIVRLVDTASLEVSAQIPIDLARFLKEKLAMTVIIEGRPVKASCVRSCPSEIRSAAASNCASQFQPEP